MVFRKRLGRGLRRGRGDPLRAAEMFLSAAVLGFGVVGSFGVRFAYASDDIGWGARANDR